ncbi:unnamed protein product [Ectocarpus sp. CCAP 1310/34]|nr:unnamed protein product [Ectocarpus sp. CCAP 1310/34]
MSARLSGVQREVNKLYRLLLRAARVKDGGEWAGSTTELVRAEFRAQAESVARTDFRTIEHLLRAGNKKLKLLKMPGVKAAAGITVVRR